MGVLATSGCQPTIGNDGAFEQAPTTNTDFAQPVRYAVGLQPYSVAIAPTRATCSAPGGTAFAPNVAIANYQGNTVTYLTNSGNGSFTPTTIAVTVAPTKVLFAALTPTDATNCRDSMVIMHTENVGANDSTAAGDAITVITTPDNINFTQQVIALGGTPFQVTVADMNNDANLDIVVSIPSLQEMVVLLNDGLGGFAATPIVTSLVGFGAPTHFVVAEQYTGVNNPLNFDGDPCADIAVLIPILAQVYQLTSNNGGSCGATSGAVGGYLFNNINSNGITPSNGIAPWNVRLNAYAIGAVDLNGDGWPDLYVTTSTEGQVSVGLNSGVTPTTFSDFPFTPLPDRAGSQRILIDKFGAAIVPSAIVARPSDGSITSIDYSGGAAGVGTFNEPTYNFDNTTPFDMISGQFTADTNLDLAVSDNKRRIVLIGQGDGTGGFGFSQLGFESAPSTAAAGQLRSATTKQDLVVPLPLDNSVMIFLNVHP